MFNGAADPMVSAEDIISFKKEMADAEVALSFVNYPDAKHGFTNPSATEKGQKYQMPLAYNKAADLDSWRGLQKFLSEIF